MKVIPSIIIFLITLSFASSQNFMDNRLIVRINNIQLDDSKLDEEFSELGIKLERRILPLKASYLYGNKLRFKSSNNEKLKRIIETEKPLLRTYIVSFTENIDALKLADILEKLHDKYGWEELGQRIKIGCFNENPSIKSSLNFLRKTPWAREKVERLYIRSFS
jgi:hypothetical protein